MIPNHLGLIRAEVARLHGAITEEGRRARPDDVRLMTLKRRKLALRDRLWALELLTPETAPGAGETPGAPMAPGVERSRVERSGVNAPGPLGEGQVRLQAGHFNALLAVCALVAQADGWVTTEEHGQMLNRMRNLEVLAPFGVDDAIEAFEALNLRFDEDHEVATLEAEQAVRRYRGRPEMGAMLIQSACAMAIADGGLDGEERHAILRLCDLLALDPALFDLVAPPRRQ